MTMWEGGGRRGEDGRCHGASWTELNVSNAAFTGLAVVNYLLTPHSTVLLEKLTGSQLIKKFPAFYGTRRFITTFTSARHLSLP